MLRKILWATAIILFQSAASLAFAQPITDDNEITTSKLMQPVAPDPAPNGIGKEQALIKNETAAITASTTSPVDQRAKKEKLIAPKFAISFYQPTYVLPYYYTFTPANKIYLGNTPNGESLKNDEVKYQLSFKVPLWQNILGSISSIYFAYTQMSYWQSYNKYAFFRSTDYQPELFLANQLDWHIAGDWRLNFFNLGLVHQSNGFGNSLERSWNRAYLQLTASTDHFMIAFRPWIVFHDNTYNERNPNMAYYLGYEQIVMALKFNSQVVSLETRNLLESGGHRTGTTLSWSFPVTKYLNGYLQVFTGYGQSLVEYDHHTNSVGIGFSLSNWI